jgi:hypothetical protein
MEGSFAATGRFSGTKCSWSAMMRKKLNLKIVYDIRDQHMIGEALYNDYLCTDIDRSHSEMKNTNRIRPDLKHDLAVSAHGRHVLEDLRMRLSTR